MPGSIPSEQSAETIWLDGEVLACACPDCAAPMSIRFWLCLADCWRCGASIELTEEQERAAQRLLNKQRDAAPAEQSTIPGAASTVAKTAAKAAAARPAPRVRPRAQSRPAPQPAPRARAKTAPASQTQAPAAERTGGGLFPWWRELPAWLASLVFHMLLVILLGLWLVEGATRPERITLSTQVNLLDREDEAPPIAELEAAEEFDPPGDPFVEEAVEDPFQPEAVAFDDLGGQEEQNPTGDLIDEADDAWMTVASAVSGSVLAGRDPRLRTQVLAEQGGTEFTEAAVARGLRWLAAHQSEAGNWSLGQFHQSGDCNGRCGGRGQHSDTAATALALLPFLGAGETHRTGQYRDTVAKGLEWLVREQKRNGDLRGAGQGRMYAHGQCAIVLCEAYALTRDSELRQPAQKALDYIVHGQHRAGGWRYAPGQAGDTSVVGWQLMALRSGQMAYLDVPRATLDKANKFLDSVQTDSYGGLYGYMPRSSHSPAMTAEALLCRQYAGWRANHPGIRAGVRDLLTNHAPNTGRPDIYYWYYGTQVLHHHGGEAWDRWNLRMRQILVDSQVTSGHAAGSWDPTGGFSNSGGRLYQTSLAICTLEVYYRHLPLYAETAIAD